MYFVFRWEATIGRCYQCRAAKGDQTKRSTLRVSESCSIRILLTICHMPRYELIMHRSVKARGSDRAPT